MIFLHFFYFLKHLVLISELFLYVVFSIRSLSVFKFEMSLIVVIGM
jgi:hypothetical protein